MEKKVSLVTIDHRGQEENDGDKGQFSNHSLLRIGREGLEMKVSLVTTVYNGQEEKDGEESQVSNFRLQRIGREGWR